MNHRMYQFFLAIASLLLFSVAALADTDIDQHRDCKHCGMDRKAYGYSRMLVEYRDGKQVGTCSLHCVATELGSRSGEIITFKVADRNSRKLIDATQSFWVIGGKKRGVMTARAKWAFASKEAAESFIKQHGGAIATWNDALNAAQEEAAQKPKI